MLALWLTAFLVGTLIGRIALLRTALPQLLINATVAVILPWAALALFGAFSRQWRRKSRLTAASGASVLTLAPWSLSCLPSCLHPAYLLLPRTGLVLVAALWGLFHSAPELSPDLVHTDASLGEVVQVDPLTVDAGRGPVLIRLHGALYATTGPRLPGALCRLRNRPVAESQLLSRYATACSLAYGGPPTASLFSWLTMARDHVRSRIDQNVEELPKRLRPWLLTLLLGDRASPPPPILIASRQLGLYQLVTAGSLHLFVLLPLFSLALRAPVYLAYALRLISATSWPHWQSAAQLTTAALALLYLSLCNQPPVAQRAVLSLLLWQASGLYWGMAPAFLRLQWLAVAQTALFPTGLLGTGSLIGWAATLLVAAGRLHSQTDRPAWYRRHGRLHLGLAAIVAAAFAQISGLSLILGPLLLPTAAVLIGSAALLIWQPWLPGRAVLLAVHTNFIGFLADVNSMAATHPALASAAGDLPSWLQAPLLVLAFCLVLNACRDLSISRYDRR